MSTTVAARTTVPPVRVDDVLRAGPPRIASASAVLCGGALLVRAARGDDVRLCARTTRDFGTGLVDVDAHVDWRPRPSSAIDDDLPGAAFDVFLEQHDGAVRALGRGAVSMVGFGDAPKVQVSLVAPPAGSLDDVVHRAAAALDGVALARALVAADVDRLALARELAESWMPPLGQPAPVDVSAAAPPPVRAWHTLWSRLARQEDHPFACWPATWARSEDVDWFQAEWQNGDTFGVRDDGSVCIHPWATLDEATTCARDVGELAVQLVLYGLVDATSGRFARADAGVEVPGLAALPLSPWRGFLGGDDVAFVGGAGMIGVRTGDETRLRVAG